MKYYLNNVNKERNWIAPTENTEIYVVGSRGNVKIKNILFRKVKKR